MRPFQLALLGTIGLALFSVFNLFGIKPDLVGNQVFFFIVGFGLYFGISRVNPRLLRSNAFLMYSIFIIILIGLLIFGGNVRGSKRWIDLFFFRFQVSEFLKPFFLLCLASVFDQGKKFGRGLTNESFIKTAGITGLVAFLIFLQPDLGTALLYSAVYLGILYVAGMSAKVYLSVLSLCFLSTPLLWHVLKDYQRNRIIGFLSPDFDPRGISYNVQQAMIAVGSGQFFGKGIGLGTQSRLKFLPEYHTDFAYASLVEQFGFFGGVIVVLLYGMIMYDLFTIARKKQQDLFAMVMIYGTALFLFISMFVNIGMNIGIMPVTGITLPFISYGGSSILSLLILMGITKSVATHSN